MGRSCDAARDRLLLRGKLHHGAHRAGFTKVVVPGCAPMHLERDEVHHQRHHLDWRARQGRIVEHRIRSASQQAADQQLVEA